MMTAENCNTSDCEPGFTRLWGTNDGKMMCVPKASWQLDYLSAIGEGESILAGIITQDQTCVDGVASGMECESIAGCEIMEMGFEAFSCRANGDQISMLAATKYPQT